MARCPKSSTRASPASSSTTSSRRSRPRGASPPESPSPSRPPMPNRKIQIDDKWYVLATFAHPEEQPQVLKNDDTFAMFDRFGDIAVLAPGQEGLYHDDT